MIPDPDRTILRDLAMRLAEHAADPIHQKRAKLWREFNALRTTRPMVWCDPEGGWREILEPRLQCRDEIARKYEWQLRRRLFQVENIRDDQIPTATWHISPKVRRGSLGVEAEHVGGHRGGHDAWAWTPAIQDPADVKMLHPREVSVDWEATETQRADAEELLGDILEVRVDTCPHIGLHFGRELIFLRGNEQLLFDMYDRPDMLHDILQILLESARNEQDVLQREGALRLNNKPDDKCGSGGCGHTDELPAEEFDGRHVRIKDLWGIVENQEFAGVSTEQTYEFAVKYEAEVGRNFGRTYYGCCEAVHDHIEMVEEALPNIRAFSISPFCDRAKAAERIADRHLYWYKPNPALTCGPTIRWNEVQDDCRETLAIAAGCRLGFALKDTHTFANDDTRPGRWVQIAREQIAAATGIPVEEQ